MSVQTELQVLLGFILGSLAISVQHFGIRLHKAREYCEAEEFRAACNADEVVIMKSAKYGRMSLGRCVIRDYGYVGCGADVMAHMDSKCSGRRSCEIRIPDLTLDRANPCPKDFKTYLEASYGCIKVPKPLCRACSNGTILQAEAPGGYLGSITVEENNCGSASCPWILQALPGQKLNVTLVDFALSSQRDSNSGNQHFGIPEICYKYAVIKERGKKKETTICGGQDRVRHMYLSDTNSIHVEVAGGRRGGNFGYFLLQYEVVGCPEYRPPSNMWLTKQEGSVTVGCTATGEKWRVMCHGNTWMGEVGECPYTGGVVSIGSSKSKLPSIPFGILIAVILAIAMVIGVLILTVGLVYIKRKRARDAEEAARRATHQHYYSTTDSEDKEKYSQYGKYHVPAHLVNNINLYAARNMEMRPLPPVPKSPTPSVASGEYNTPNQNEYNEPNQSNSGDGVFGVPSPHSGDFCTMPLPGRSGAYPQLRPQRRSSGDILEYPEENSPHYFELDPEGLPLPPPPEALLRSGVDVAPVHNTRLTSPGNNNTRKPMANGIALPGMHAKTPEQENRENFGRETMTSRQDSVTSQHDTIPKIDYRGLGFADDHAESGKFSWP